MRRARAVYLRFVLRCHLSWRPSLSWQATDTRASCMPLQSRGSPSGPESISAAYRILQNKRSKKKNVLNWKVSFLFICYFVKLIAHWIEAESIDLCQSQKSMQTAIAAFPNMPIRLWRRLFSTYIPRLRGTLCNWNSDHRPFSRQLLKHRPESQEQSVCVWEGKGEHFDGVLVVLIEKWTSHLSKSFWTKEWGIEKYTINRQSAVVPIRRNMYRVRLVFIVHSLAPSRYQQQKNKMRPYFLHENSHVIDSVKNYRI